MCEKCYRPDWATCQQRTLGAPHAPKERQGEDNANFRQRRVATRMLRVVSQFCSFLPHVFTSVDTSSTLYPAGWKVAYGVKAQSLTSLLRPLCTESHPSCL